MFQGLCSDARAETLTLAIANANWDYGDSALNYPFHCFGFRPRVPVAVILRAGKTPAGAEVRTVLKHVIARIRDHLV